MVAHKVKHTMIGVNCVSSRLIYARFKGQGVNLSVIQAYAPTSASSVEDLDKFYGNLQTTYDSVDKSDLLILMGDWNAKLVMILASGLPFLGNLVSQVAMRTVCAF